MDNYIGMLWYLDVSVYDKETDIKLASTGTTSLSGVIRILKMPFDKCPWR